MFYLIENNKIIKHSDKTQVEKYGDTNYLKYKNRNKLSLIKTQSDNVLDLIEVGDLIRYNDEFLGAFPLREVYLHNGELQLLDEINIKCLDITEIYKPNSKGDYIKVWDSK